jgi:sugar phosphate isomerase/epimerase
MINPRISRRGFLAAVGKSGALAALHPLIDGARAAESVASAVKPWQIGCYTRAFDQFDYKVALDAIAEAGFSYVGIMTTNSKQWVMINPTTPSVEVQSMQAEAEKRGLKVLSVYGDFSASDPPSIAEEKLRFLIDHCATCKCPNLLLGGTSEEKLYQAYYGTVAKCCPYAAERGVSLSVKPHGGQNATGPQCRKAIELVGQKNFGLWYDPGNIFYYSDGKLDPVDDAATVDGLVAGMSVKDFQPPKEVLVNPGSGKVNFPTVMARLKKGGFNGGPLLLECLERGPLENVKASAKKARKFMEDLTTATL